MGFRSHRLEPLALFRILLSYSIAALLPFIAAFTSLAAPSDDPYLKQLIENGTTVRVKMSDGEEVSGIIEYYDASFIRITRKDGPNLFIFKHDIKYLMEEE